MAISQPVATDKQNNPSHSLSHRVFANDPSSPAQTVTVDATGVIKMGSDGGVANYVQVSAAGLMDFFGTAGISLANAQFSSSATQTIANTTLAYPITYTDTDKSHGGILLTNNSRINIANAGTYLVTFSAIGKSTTANKTLDIWLAVDGTNVPNSNTISRFVGAANERIITVTFIYAFTAGQYFELYWNSNDTGTTLVAAGVQASPTRPACPSVILTVNMISKD